MAIGVVRLGRVSLEAWGRVMRKVLSSTASSCYGLVVEPAAIWVVGKPPRVTARSNDHFTS